MNNTTSTREYRIQYSFRWQRAKWIKIAFILNWIIIVRFNGKIITQLILIPGYTTYFHRFSLHQDPIPIPLMHLAPANVDDILGWDAAIDRIPDSSNGRGAAVIQQAPTPSRQLLCKLNQMIESDSDLIIFYLSLSLMPSWCRYISYIYIRYTYISHYMADANTVFSKHSTSSRAPFICFFFSFGTYMCICNMHVIKSRVELNASRSETQLECAYADVCRYIYYIVIYILCIHILSLSWIADDTYIVFIVNSRIHEAILIVSRLHTYMNFKQNVECKMLILL